MKTKKNIKISKIYPKKCILIDFLIMDKFDNVKKRLNNYIRHYIINIINIFFFHEM